jgi:hypothetical protein
MYSENNINTKDLMANALGVVETVVKGMSNDQLREGLDAARQTLLVYEIEVEHRITVQMDTLKIIDELVDVVETHAELLEYGDCGDCDSTDVRDLLKKVKPESGVEKETENDN